jgi:flagellar basal-body rod modification protein FlgD
MDATSIKSLGSPDGSTQAASGKNSELGKDQFLKLFVAQLQHQDPMNPMQDQDFMGQMASFSTLEQITNLASASSLSQTVGLIGRTVTYTDTTGEARTGVVEKVNHTKDGPVLTVGGTPGVDPSTITQIA